MTEKSKYEIREGIPFHFQDIFHLFKALSLYVLIHCNDHISLFPQLIVAYYLCKPKCHFHSLSTGFPLGRRRVPCPLLQKSTGNEVVGKSHEAALIR